MFQIGTITPSNLVGQLPYWDTPSAKDFDFYFDATLNGFKRKPTWGNQLSTVISDAHADGNARVQRANGEWVAKAANELCREDTGLWTQPTRTNSIPNSSMTGALPGSPGTLPTTWQGAGTERGISKTVVGTGVENGLPYIDIRFAGTVDAAGVVQIGFANSTAIVVSPAQVWSGSAYFQFLSGPIGSVRFSFNENDAAGAYLAESNGAALLQNTNRQFTQVTRTIATGARLQPWMKIGVTLGQVIDTTIRISAPQAELGAFPTSPILTTNSSLTRNSNQQNIVDFGTSFAQGFAGIIKIDNMGANPDNTRPLYISANANGDFQMRLDNFGGNLRMVVSSAGALSAVLTLGPVIIGEQTIAFAAQENFFVGRRVGNAQQTDNLGEYPTGLNQVQIGGHSSVAVYQKTKKFGLRFGPQNQASFDAIYALAQLA